MPSHGYFRQGFMLPEDTILWFRERYLPDLKLESDPRASPLFASDLSGLPPALVVTAGFDPLRDEGRAYADRLRQAGVHGRVRVLRGIDARLPEHGGRDRESARVLDLVARRLREGLAQRRDPGGMNRPGRADRERSVPMSAGGLLALASAVTFGATTPFVQRFGRGIGPFTTAALLYGGAALFSALPRARREPAALRAGDLPRLAVVASLGAVVAPVALAWGLQRTSGVGASLLLNLEALFTALLARALWAEPIGARSGGALLAMTAGGGLLVASGQASSPGTAWGALAVVAATLAWAADNAVGRPLADRDPTRVVLAKGALGAAASATLAAAFGERWPPGVTLTALTVCGALGYGASLTLYLRAQRAIGAARTGSIFAAAPFVGAALAWAMGERMAGPATVAAGALLALGVWLHLTEAHEHEHTHGGVEHDHAHSHDDLHHGHDHATYPRGEHSHPHRHEPTTHVHSHGLDIHHRHRH